MSKEGIENLKAAIMGVDLSNYQRSLALQELHRLQARIATLEDALEIAIIGTEWWIKNYPEGWGKEDPEKLQEWKEILKIK